MNARSCIALIGRIRSQHAPSRTHAELVTCQQHLSSCFDLARSQLCHPSALQGLTLLHMCLHMSRRLAVSECVSPATPINTCAVQWSVLPPTCGDNQSAAGPGQHSAVLHLSISPSGHSPLHRCTHAAAALGSTSGSEGSGALQLETTAPAKTATVVSLP